MLVAHHTAPTIGGVLLKGQGSTNKQHEPFPFNNTPHMVEAVYSPIGSVHDKLYLYSSRINTPPLDGAVCYCKGGVHNKNK